MEDNTEEGQGEKGCAECCTRCAGGLPYASLFATVLLYLGVALFCGCGHEALGGAVLILQDHFQLARGPADALDLFTMIDIFQYVIYGVAAAFFVYGLLLLVEGFCTTGAIRELYGELKISACGRCVSAGFLLLSYLLFVVWLGVALFSALPVFMLYNVWSLCPNASMPDDPNVSPPGHAPLCMDLRQFGLVSFSEEKKMCTGSENFLKMCESNELDLTFHLFVCSLAGAGAAVIAMVHYLMALAANWAYLKDASRQQKYDDVRSREEQELHHLSSTRSKDRLHAYT